MSIMAHLIHRCVIARRTATGAKDVHGNPVYVWVEGEAMACRLVSRQMRDVQGVTADVTAAGKYRLLLPAGASVWAGDRVTVMGSGVAQTLRYEVTGVLPRRARAQHHVTALVEAIDGMA